MRGWMATTRGKKESALGQPALLMSLTDGLMMVRMSQSQRFPATDINSPVGRVMFLLPILFGWGSIYAADLIPGFAAHPLPYAIVGDVVLLASLFVLGGNFWDKVRSLFVYESEALFSESSEGTGRRPD